MKKLQFPTVSILSLAFTLTLSLCFLTSCDDDDEDESETTSDSDSNSYDTDTDSSTDDSSSMEVGKAVNLGLSVKWADINVGATLPADYGNYYAWGETKTKDSFVEDCATTGISIADFSGDATYDAATANWGSSWRTPTYAECRELVTDCTWESASQKDSNGHTIYGFLVSGSNGNSIFLPLSGYIDEALSDPDGWYTYTEGNYWCSTQYVHYGKYDAYLLFIDEGGDWIRVTYSGRSGGYSVRPVKD